MSNFEINAVQCRGDLIHREDILGLLNAFANIYDNADLNDKLDSPTEWWAIQLADINGAIESIFRPRISTGEFDLEKDGFCRQIGLWNHFYIYENESTGEIVREVKWDSEAKAWNGSHSRWSLYMYDVEDSRFGNTWPVIRKRFANGREVKWGGTAIPQTQSQTQEVTQS